MTVPTNTEILALLDQLDFYKADDLESEHLDFKQWVGQKKAREVALEYAVCFANTDGGAIVFGVRKDTLGRANAIQGVEDYCIDGLKRDIHQNTKPSITVEIEEIEVPEGTCRLLVVRVPKGDRPPYCTLKGLYTHRLGKNCMGMDPSDVARAKVSSGAVDWSGEFADGVKVEDLDSLEIARARAFLRSRKPDSDLLKHSDEGFLQGIQAVRRGRVTNAGLLLFGRAEDIIEYCPQSQVHYVHMTSETKVARTDRWHLGLLQVIEKLEGIFSSPVNPEEEVPVGLTQIRIPAFPIDVVREAVLNAITHRDYLDPNEVLIRHLPRELIVTSPGGFIGGITPQNILRHDPIPRNRTLANAFERLRLVDSAGVGRLKIFTPMLQYGKRMPRYDADEHHVALRIFDGVFDRRMAAMIAQFTSEGKEIGLDGLIVLAHLKDHQHIDTATASDLLQYDNDHTRQALDQMSHPSWGILERKGHTRMATYHLSKAIARELIGKAAYTRMRGIELAQYEEFVRRYIRDHGSITNQECRDLLNLGDSNSARVEASRYLKGWSGPDGFLTAEGNSSQRRYRLKRS